jgi:hypothetical protein
MIMGSMIITLVGVTVFMLGSWGGRVRAQGNGGSLQDILAGKGGDQGRYKYPTSFTQGIVPVSLWWMFYLGKEGACLSNKMRGRDEKRGQKMRVWMDVMR